MLFRRLYDFGEFLLNLDHRIVYVGEIGVGKTTAACRQAGLVTNPSAPADLKGMMLDTGGGRTTLCDVYVRGGDRFCWRLRPFQMKKYIALSKNFAGRLVGKRERDLSFNSGDFKLPEEVERALRNMAGLLRPVRRKAGTPEPDPAAELASAQEVSDFKADVASRLTLWRRNSSRHRFRGR